MNNREGVPSLAEMAYEHEDGSNRYDILLRRHYGGDVYFDPETNEYVPGEDLLYFLDCEEQEGIIPVSNTISEMLSTIRFYLMILARNEEVAYTTPWEFLEQVLHRRIAGQLNRDVEYVERKMKKLEKVGLRKGPDGKKMRIE